MSQIVHQDAIDLSGTVGLLGGEYAQLFRDFGGTYLGLVLAEELSQTLPICVPRRCTVAVDAVSDGTIDGIVERVLRSLSGGFVIKYSGHREGFSRFCVRGIHSSRDRSWDGRDADAARRLLRRAAAQAPPATRLLVLQEIVRSPSLTGIFHSYAYPDRVLIEAVGAGRRSFTETRRDVVSRQHHVAAAHIRSAGDQLIDTTLAAQVMAGIRTRLGFDVDVEGFGLGDRVMVLQLRPIPQDMPVRPEVRAVIDSHLTGDPTGWYRTPLVWGSWSEGTCPVDEDLPGRPAILLKRTADIRDWTPLMARLRRGDPTLVIDCVDGFRLSHQPTNLPAAPAHRQYFSYLSVAGTPLVSLRPGERVEAYVDGDRGILRLKPAAYGSSVARLDPTLFASGIPRSV
jgi:hypothetical protein